MPRIVAGVGPSNARAEQEQPEVVHFEFAVTPESEPVEVPVSESLVVVEDAAPELVVVEDAPKPAKAAAPAPDAPVAAAKDGAA